MLPSKKHIRRPRVRTAHTHTAASVACKEKEIIELPPAVESHLGRATMVGTLSFPVRGRENCPLRDNSDIIAEIIRRRTPGLLLCAGSSVPSKKSLRPIMDATRQRATVVVLESTSPAISYRICGGRSFSMGKQFYATREDTNKHPWKLCKLANALAERSFHFSGRPVLLLVC